MEQNRNNLTALRWLAASLVLYGHSFVFLGLPEPNFMGWLPLGTLGVYIFFSISGYLVMQSWERDRHLWRFLARRALRIFPGLAVCILVTVFVLGPLLTNLSLGEYFRNPHTLGYLKNIVLYISYYLPGVFDTNRYPGAVNGSLWSLPLEFAMYLMLAGVGFLRLPRWTWVGLTALFFAVGAYLAMHPAIRWVAYASDMRQLFVCGTFFWVGALYSRHGVERFFSTTTLLGSIILWLGLSRWPTLFSMAGFFILPFLVLAFGLARSRLLGALGRYDYSYGIYIYAFPIQQTFAKFYPGMPLGYYLLATGLVTVLLAAMSWHFIEKTALNFKPRGRTSTSP